MINYHHQAIRNAFKGRTILGVMGEVYTIKENPRGPRYSVYEGTTELDSFNTPDMFWIATDGSIDFDNNTITINW